METIVRNVGDFDAGDRQALENLLGLGLREDQQLVISIVNPQVPLPVGPRGLPVQAAGAAMLPEWCNVYAGLTDDEVDELDQAIVRSPGGRAID